MTYRRAEEADLPRVYAVFRAALNAYLVPAGQPEDPRESDQQSPATGTSCGTTASGSGWPRPSSRSWPAAGAARSASPAARSSAGARGLLRGDWWFLSSLFVLPEAQGLGVGARLFELAATGAPPGAVRATVTDSLQPISNTLYAHRGLLPREVLVGFGGQAREGLAAPRLGTLVPERLTLRRDPRAARDRRRGQRPRPQRRPRVLPRPTAAGTDGSFRRRGRAVAYVVLREDGWVGPVAALRERDIHTATAYGIADLVGRGGIAQGARRRHRPLRGRPAGVLGGRAGVRRHAGPAPRLAAVRPPRPLRRRQLRHVLRRSPRRRPAPVPGPRDTVR